ncbi:FT-interacting protein 3-like [Phoenix dactylifera]|uniref:FT-interacting protein 3-like n=1 Tax=Phoenix dactylifera TaxID=42345 RepID=A0A8B7BQM2_PHODC|nr:FT-interacting protein 3-like [Phoenix dactylifera]
MKVAVEVVDAAELMPKDGQGSANPFVEVELDGQRHRTQTKVKDLNPFWNEKFLFNVSDPSDLYNQTINVSVYHDSRLPSDGGGRHGHQRQFLGRVRISGASVAISPADAPVQRFPLEKRGLFSHIRGDIGLRVYLLPDSSDPFPAAAAAAAAVPPSSVPTPNPAVDGERAYHKNKEKMKKPAAEEPRAFYSVGAGGGLGYEFAQMKQAMGGGAGEKPAAPMGGGVAVNERYARAEPPQPAVMNVRAVPGAAPPPRPGAPEFGLVETYPPIASRLGYRGRDKMASTYDLVEPMQFLYVNVVKARDLPTMDLTGSLDPYVEVKLGNYKGTTKYLEKNQNPVWRQVFAFSKDRLQANVLEVTVKDHDLVKDDFVGRILLDLIDVPLRVPPDSPLAPQWYRLEDKSGNKVMKGEIMLAVWLGTQADETFPEAWHSDAHNVGVEGLQHTRSKVYFSPKLVYLRVIVVEAQDLVLLDKSRQPSVWLKLQHGGQLRRTRPNASLNPVWNEEFMFVASEPFDEPLVITVEDKEPLGRLVLPLSNAVQRIDPSKPPVLPRWFSLSKPSPWGDDAGTGEKKKEPKFASKVCLWLCLEMGYHVLDESTHYSSDLQPASRNLRKRSIGILELGILDARNLMPMKAKDGKLTDAYCVAKYGPKWVRTRTILNSLAPRWHEQYTWEVFDPCTVITIAVFDNCHISSNKDDAKDQRIGKVRIRLSTLETNRVYTHYYPLLVLQSSGLKKTGELHLAVRFTCTAWVNMVTLYGRPLLPKMHYVKPIPVFQLDNLRHQAMQIVAARLGRAEPPLRREVVEYMLDVGSHMWSLRRSKANFFRISALLSGLGAIGRWFDGIRNWRNPITTILVHVLFLILVGYPELILPTIFLYLFMIGLWNYRLRPRHPPHMDTKLSHAEFTHPDELDEEFDTFPTSRPPNIVRMRYDRLRSVAGRVQTVVGDLATQGERAQALLSWRDPRATAIFIMLSLIVAIILYVTPFQVVAVLVGLYLLRHPKFRSKMPSVPFNFYRRLPAKSDMLL